MYSRVSQLIVGIALCGVLALNACANEADDQFAVAADHYTAKRWDAAAAEFGKFLAAYPDHAKRGPALFFKGESLVQLGRYDKAYPLFLDLLADEPAGPHTRQALFRAAEAAVKTDKTAEAQIRLSQFQTKYPNDRLNANVLLYRGSMALHAGDVAQAEQFYRESLERFGDAAVADECRITLARTLDIQKQSGGAEQLLRQVAEHDHSPWTETALLDLASKQLVANKPQAALELYDSITKRFPNGPLEAQAHLGCGRALYQLARYDEAQKVLVDLSTKKDPKDLASDARHWLDLTQKAQKQLKVAQELAKPAVKPVPTTSENKTAGTSSRRDPTSAPTPNSSLIAVKSPPDQPTAAANPPAQVQLVESEKVGPQHDEQTRRRSAIIRYQAADSMIRSGDYGRAIATLEIGDNSGDDPRTLANRYLLAMALERAKRTDDALRTIEELNTTLARKLANTTQQATIISADDMVALNSLNDDVQLAHGLLLAARKQFAEAIEPLRNYLTRPSKDGEMERARSTLATCLVRCKRIEEARHVLDDMAVHGSASSLLTSAMSQVADAAYDSGQYEIAAELFQKLAADGNSSEMIGKGLAGVAWCHYQTGENEAAAAEFARFLQRFPNDPRAAEMSLARAQALEHDMKLEAALDAYRQAISRYGKSKELPKILAAAARLYDRLEQDEEALPLYQRLVHEFPDSPDIDATLYGWAWCLRDLGRGKESDKIFHQLYEQYPNSRFWADATYRLAERAVQHGERAAADIYIEQLMSVDCPTAVLEHALFLQSQMAVSDQKWVAAEAPLKRILVDFPDGALHLPAEFWLAEVAYRQGDFATARQRFDALSPRIEKRDEAWMATVPLRRAQMLADEKQWSAAQALAETIAHDYPQFNQQFEADYVIARCFVAEGDLESARVACQRVVRSAAGGKTETAAMAQCMIGDSFFELQNYATALREYLRVESLYPYPHWQATALLQAAKCHEQLGHEKDAAELVARVRQNYQERVSVVVAKKPSATTTVK